MANVYNCGVFFDLAKRAYERAKLSDDREAVVAIILSAIAFESFLNELTEDSVGQQKAEDCPDEIRTLGAMLEELEKQKAQLGMKIQMIHFILTKAYLKRGEEPYQSFQLLINLRNALAHNRPEGWPADASGAGYQSHKFIKLLADRGVIDLPGKDSPPQLLTFLCKPEVGRWACNTTVEMIDFLIDRFPPSEFKSSLLNEYGGIKKIPRVD